MKLPPRLWKLLSHRHTRRVLIAGASALILAAALFYPVANWWGERCLAQTVADCEAAGIPTTLDGAFGTVPAAEEDVFQHPAWRLEATRTSSRLAKLQSMSIGGLNMKSKAWKVDPDSGALPDIRDWLNPPAVGVNEAEAAKQVLALFTAESKRFDDLTEALRRPKADFRTNRTNLTTMSMPLLPTRSFAAFAADRITLRLATGRTNEAYQDVIAILDLEALAVRGRPTLLDGLILQITHQELRSSIWQGIFRQTWSEDQLAGFAGRLDEIDFAKVSVTCLRHEFAYGLDVLRQAAEDPDHLKDDPTWGDVGKSFGDALSKRSTNDLHEGFYAAWYKARPWGIDLSKAASDFEAMKDACVSHPDGRFTMAEYSRYDLGAKVGTGSFMLDNPVENTLKNTAKISLGGRTTNDLLRCGIAAERYRLKNGRSPASLAALVPEFLPAVPRDVCDGRELRYALLPDGSSHVWSSWPSGSDEGGIRRPGSLGNLFWATGKLPVPAKK